MEEKFNKCLRWILKDIEPTNDIPVDNIFQYWHDTMTTAEDRSQDLQNVDIFDNCLDVLKPITPDEVKDTKLPKSTAPGPDGLKVGNLYKISNVELSMILNIFLWCGRVPEHLLQSRTALIPKKVDMNNPGDLRPITVSST